MHVSYYATATKNVANEYLMVRPKNQTFSGQQASLINDNDW